jgi:tetratricopeptide (TPR) repeat protein
MIRQFIISLNNQLEESYFYLGNVQMQLEQFEKAITSYDRSLRLDPKQSNAYYNRGIAKHRLNQVAGACADMQRAVDLGRSGAADTFRKMCK